MKVVITGGAGFIGSHLAENLIAQGEVIILDNLSSGRLDNLRDLLGNPSFRFVDCDLKNFEGWKDVLDGVSLVYHFAANPEVRVGEVEPALHFQENLLATFRLLEAIRKSKEANTIVFASTSTVYGEATELPTPEDYGTLLPISTYGASKLGCEALLSAYAHTHSIRALVLRLGNCVGSPGQHGIISDFIRKLKADPEHLEILGDGRQEKSYVHVEDCIDGITCAKDHLLKAQELLDIYNLSSLDRIAVKRIGEIVAEEMGLSSVRMSFTGGVDGGRGWLGDVKVMHLSTKKLQGLGWKAKFNSEEAVRKATRELLT